MHKFVPVFVVGLYIFIGTVYTVKPEIKGTEIEQILANGDVRKSPLNPAQRKWIDEPPVQDDIVKSTRIVGGRHSKPGEAPYLVVISYKGINQWCGGAIYSRDTIVTAAHCLYYAFNKVPANQLVFTAGEFDLEKQDRTEMRRLGDRDFIPDNYDPNEFPNDIAVIKLQEPLRFTYSVQPVPLATLGMDYEKDLTIGGFGYTRQKRPGESTYSNGYSSILKVSTVKERTKDECRTIFEEVPDVKKLIEHETYYCAGGHDYEGSPTDACQGDSGGPAVCVGPQNRKHLCGVISSGYGCGLPGIPGIFTNVSYYNSWIRKHGGEPDPPTRLY